MAKSYRKERLNETIKELLSELIIKRVKDPRVGFVTITSVKVSADLYSAKVFFSVMGDDEERTESAKGLQSAQNFLRKTIGRELKLHNSPELHFVYDDSLDRALGIEEAIKKARERDREQSSE